MPGHDQVTIASLAAKYHLPPSRFGEKERLDRILPVAAEEALAAALERLGYGGSEELCIREVRVPLRLRLSAPDDSLALAWGDAMAAAIDAAVRGGDAERVLRFPSRRAALAEFARGVASGDLRQGWAFRQLGFGEEAGESGEAPAELARALASDPEALVPILAGVAEAGLLPALVRRFEPGWWPQLAALALATVGWSAIAFRSYPLAASAATGAAAPGRNPELPLEARSAATAGGERNGAAVDRRPAPASSGAWRRARLAELFELLPVREGSPLAQALAALALLEADPGRLASTPENEREALLEAAVATLLSPFREKTATARQPLPAADEPATPEVTGDGDGDQPCSAADAEAGDMLSSRREGVTGWGGLLFLIGLADEIGLPQTIAAQTALASRPHRWCLHRLALELVPAGAEDPAILAFAGLLPGEPPPEGEGTEDEIAVLAGLAEMLLQSLRERLPRPGAGGTPGAEPVDDESRPEEPPFYGERERLARSSNPQGAQPLTEAPSPGAGGTPAHPVAEPADADSRRKGEDSPSLEKKQSTAEDEYPYWVRGRLARSSRLELLELVCRRRARIVADPGWIEVHFSLDDVRTELRRARLDLDPGFVPWLGVVLRFVYE